ncbi:hypothetical protein HK405_013962, partial [Cladochytrium tenue]
MGKLKKALASFQREQLQRDRVRRRTDQQLAKQARRHAGVAAASGGGGGRGGSPQDKGRRGVDGQAKEGRRSAATLAPSPSSKSQDIATASSKEGDDSSAKVSDEANTSGRKRKHAADAEADFKPATPLRALIVQPTDTVLLVGEGNFSFAASLCLLFGGGDATNLWATSFDTAVQLDEKYPDAADNVALLRDHGAHVLHAVDATALQDCRALSAAKAATAGGGGGRGGLMAFDRVVFNFPHAGAGLKDQARNAEANRKLLLGFFASAQRFLAPKGKI